MDVVSKPRTVDMLRYVQIEKITKMVKHVSTKIKLHEHNSMVEYDVTELCFNQRLKAQA